MVFSEVITIILLFAIIGSAGYLIFSIIRNIYNNDKKNKKESELDLLKKIYNRAGWILFWVFLIFLAVSSL